MAALGADDDMHTVLIAAQGPVFTVGLDLMAMAHTLIQNGAGEAGVRQNGNITGARYERPAPQACS